MSPAALLAASATAIAGLLLLPPRVPHAAREGGRPATTMPRWLLRIAPAGVLLLPLWLHGRELALGVIGVLTVLAVAHLVHRARAARAAERRAERLLAACRELAADLEAGEPSGHALALAARDWPELAPVSRAAELGADVPTALRTLADAPGAEHLRSVAAAWQVAHRSGGRLAPAVSRAADSMAAERRLRRTLGAELAAAHATARLLALLPLVLVLMGRGIGGDPLVFLLDTPAGLACLGGGLALSFLGMVWLDRIAAGVLR